MVVGRRGAQRAVVFSFFFFGVALAVANVASAKPKESKDEAASRAEQKAVQVYVAGDPDAAVHMIDRALKTCEPPNACSAKTKSRLRMTLGTVRGAGQGDYGTARKEFVMALVLDPDAKLSPVLANAQLRSAFDDARAAVEAAKADKTPEKGTEKPPEKPPEKPDKPLSVTDLLHPEEPPPPPPKKVDPKAEDLGPQPRYNWFSARVMVDWAFMSDANICSPGAPSSYFCTDETGARYTGRPQPFDDVTPGFALSTARLVLGYERLLFAGLTAGAFIGYAHAFAGSPEGRSGIFPVHLEARATYTFGAAPFLDDGDRINPFAFVSLGLAEFDSHVVIRAYEIPCQSRPTPACKQDLDAYRRSGRVFSTLGGGVRVRIEGPHAVRAGMRATVVLSDGTFVVSPEVGYEMGL